MKAGDAVKATLRDGRELELIFVEETAHHIVGRDRTGSVRKISRQDISSLEVTKVSAVRTVLMVGGILLVCELAEYVAASLFDRMALPL